jgi:hypothetical protein
VNVVADSNNVANVLIKKYQKAADPKPSCFIIQLPRCALRSQRFDAHEFCILLERVADGCLETTKYQGFSLQIERPWVFIFSNDHLPRRWIDDEYLTYDRWCCMTIGDLSPADNQKILDYELQMESLQSRPAIDLPGFT